MKQNLKAILCLATIGGATCSFGQSFNFSDITNWVGTGTNQAAIVIDFQDGSAHPAYAWGFRWNGNASGEDLFKAVLGADPNLSSVITSYSFGDAVSSIAYNGTAAGFGTHSQDGFNSGTPGYWDYWTETTPSTTVPDQPGSGANPWLESGVGFSARTLSNDSWDGWSWAANFVSTPPGTNITPAPSAAPEPIPAVAIGIGAALFLAEKRRK